MGETSIAEDEKETIHNFFGFRATERKINIAMQTMYAALNLAETNRRREENEILIDFHFVVLASVEGLLAVDAVSDVSRYERRKN